MSLDVNISEPDEFNCMELHSCITEVAKVKGIDDFEYHVEYVNGKGDHYIANIFRVTIKDTSDSEKKCDVIVKTLINTTRQELFHELHEREIYVYRELIPKYEAVQESLKLDDRLILPKCLYSSDENRREIIILDDLILKDFEVIGKLTNYETLDLFEVTTVLRELAKFHALSFVLMKNEPDDFVKVKSQFYDLLFKDSFLNKSKLRNYFNESFDLSLKVVEDANAKKKLLKIATKLLPILKDCVKPTEVNVLCHGDCWIKNILLKYDEHKETRVCFVDYQVMRYASPASDIIHFLYLCTNSKFRSDYLKEIKNTYYYSLKSYLNLFAIDVDSAYPKSNFDEDMQDKLGYGLIIALVELRIITTTPEDEAILKGGKIVPGDDGTEIGGEIDLFRIRVNDVVNEGMENGCIDRLIEKYKC